MPRPMLLNIIIQQLFIVTCYVLGTMITVIHLFRVHLLNTDHAPGTGLATGSTAISKTHIPILVKPRAGETMEKR